MVEKSKDDLKREKAIRIVTMINSAITMLEDLETDVKLWSSDTEIDSETQMKHMMHQNETCANLQFFIDYLQNKQRRT
jgi:hypothetical protein